MIFWCSKTCHTRPFASAWLSLLATVGLLTAACRAESPLDRPRDLQLSWEGLTFRFGQGVVMIPDQSFDTTILDFPVQLVMSNITCSNMTIGDLDLNWDPELPRNVLAKIVVEDVGLVCTLDFTFESAIVQGSGGADLLVGQSGIKGSLLVQPPNLATEASSVITVQSCQTDVNIQSINFYADEPDATITYILSATEEALREMLAGEVEPAVCDLFSSVEDGVGALFDAVDEALTPYLVQREEADPLAHEHDLIVPEGVKFLNFLYPESTIGILLDLALGIGNLYLGSPVDSGDLVVSGVFRSLLLNNDEAVSVELQDTRYDLEKSGIFGAFDAFGVTPASMGLSAIRLDQVNLKGIDHFSSFDAFNKIGNHTVEASFTLNQLTFEVLGALERMGFESDPDSDEDFVLRLNLTKVELKTSFLLAVDETAVAQLPLGTVLMGGENLVACVMPMIHVLKVTGFRMDTYAFQPPSLEMQGKTVVPEVFRGFLEAFLDLTINSFENVLSKAIPEILRPNIMDYFNDGRMKDVPGAKEICSEPLVVSEGPYTDFRDLFLPPRQALEYGGSLTRPYGNFSSTIKTLLDKQVFADDPDTGVPYINDRVIAPLTQTYWTGETGVFYYTGQFFAVRQDISLVGSDVQLDIKLSDLLLENLDSFQSPLTLLDPVPNKGSGLINRFAIGTLEKPLKMTFRLVIDVTTDNDVSNNVFDVTVNMSSLSFLADSLVNTVEADLFKYPLGDAAIISCLASVLKVPELDISGLRMIGSDPPYEFDQVDFQMDGLKFAFTCIECSSPFFSQVAGHLSSVGEIGTDARMKDGNATGILDLLMVLFGNSTSLQMQIDQLLMNSRTQCRHRPEYDPNSSPMVFSPSQIVGIDMMSGASGEDFTAYTIAVVIVLCLVLVGVLFVSFILRRIVARRQKLWLESLPLDQVKLIYKRQKQDDEETAQLNELSASVFGSGDVPQIMRWLIPVLLLGSVGLFLSGMLSPAARIDAKVFIMDQLAVDFSIEFSMKSIIQETWNAGGKALVILATLASGVWPPVKQLITLALWFLPPSFISVDKRGMLLQLLDVLGKWTMFIVFLGIFNVAAFRLEFESPSNVSFLPEGLYRVEVVYVPIWGLYASCLAQLLSQVLSRVIIHCHRKVVKNTRLENGLRLLRSESSEQDQEEPHDDLNSQTSSNGDPRGHVALCNTSFARPHRGESGHLLVRPSVNLSIAFLAVVCVALVIVGCVFPTYSYRVEGILSLAEGSVTSGDEQGVFSLTRVLFEQASYLGSAKHYVGLGAIAVCFVLGVFAVPLMLIAAVMVQWYLPMGRKLRSRLRALIEVLLSIEYLEVYVISVVICALQIDDLSQYLISGYCSIFNSVLAGFLNSDGGQCFRVVGSVEYAGLFLVLATVLLYFLTLFVIAAVLQKRMEDTQLTHMMLSTSPSMEDNKPTGKFSVNLGKKLGDCVLDLPDSPEQVEVVIDTIEAAANRIVAENHPIRCYQQTKVEFVEQLGQNGVLDGSHNKTSTIAEKIHPLPLLFTDRFRWLLQRDES